MLTASDVSASLPEVPYAPSSREPIVVLEGVSVQYRVPKERIGTFKEYAIRALQRRLQFMKFLALKDVNLTIYR
ncbi:MAG TPA: hypothetical protein PL025_06490, partial [Anaerolineaceae bacterium]|nr:hypothetical protein [Anaerolineaceae bacterium]